jgi:A/G-specific adenine glycosylase
MKGDASGSADLHYNPDSFPVATAMSDFATRLIAWQHHHGRHDLPWQNTCDPYRVWLSEVMLQQTQVTTVIPYYQRFLARFPDINSLAAADENEVLQHWSGLGYYSRARNLHAAAGIMTEKHAGQFPRDFAQILDLPGIGRSTAAAISAFAFGERRAILDGNVKRVFARCFGIDGFPGSKAVENSMWQQAESLLPQQNIAAYTQALMDLGATLCTRSRPDCAACPLEKECVALAQQRVNELPTRRPKKALPQRATIMLLLRHQGEILLEKRPPSGIWGGLWSFPEIEEGTDVMQRCSERFGMTVESEPAMHSLDHTFTHFKLRITPQPLVVTGMLPRATQPGQLWLTLEDAIDAAIPSPVRTLLQRLTQAGKVKK